MSIQRIASVIMILAGFAACFSGVGTIVHANDEDPERCPLDPNYLTPAVCNPAVQVPPQSVPFEEDTSIGCVNWYYLWCWPDPEIGCWVEGYGMALHGFCEHDLGESAVGLCFNNFQEDVVMCQYHRSECEFWEAQCQCLWVLGELPPAPAIICNCAMVL